MTRSNSNWIKAFIEYSSYGEAPLKTLFWTGVSTVAGALRRKVWIDQKYFQWTPCFYIILVAPPGVISKSTTANIGINLLREVPGINFGPDAITWQALVQHLGTLGESFHIASTDTYHPMSAITICSDELGNFLDPLDNGMMNSLIALWDGKQGGFSKMTKTNGNDSIDNPWINLIGCTTPSWIKDNFPESMIGGGFTSRCIFVFAEKKRQLIAYPSLVVPEDFEAIRNGLISDLEQISTMAGEYRLTPEAFQWGTAWYEDLWTHRPAHLEDERFGGYVARKQTHIHKLAMILAAAKSSELWIDKETLIDAANFVTALEHDMPRVFNAIGMTDTTRGMSELVRIVLAKREIPQTDLYRLLFSKMSAKEFQEALSSAIAAGFVQFTQTEGRPVVRALIEAPTAKDH